MRQLNKLMILAMIALPFVGCSGSTADSNIQSPEIYSTAIRQEQEITDPEILAWRDTYSRQPGVFLHEFKHQRVLLISLGQKPTGGYTIELKPIQKQDKTWQVRYRVVQPKPGTVATQAITFPSRLVVFPKDEHQLVVWEVGPSGNLPQTITSTATGHQPTEKSIR